MCRSGKPAHTYWEFNMFIYENINTSAVSNTVILVPRLAPSCLSPSAAELLTVCSLFPLQSSNSLVVCLVLMKKS